jgi:Domain of unknown function (DUF4232)
VTRAALLAAVGLAAAGILAGCGGGGVTTVTVTVTHTRTVTTTAPPPRTTPSAASAPCTGSDLQGTFAVLPGSAGAGQISYVLTVTNSSTASCFVSGIPGVQLLDASGAPLPTHVAAAHPGQALAAKITLAPGDSASAEARFSPDVPGVGEQHQGPCEPKAVTMRVSTIGAATVEVPISPPTSVCEQGSLRFDLFASGR